jgi:hypothetical protein
MQAASPYLNLPLRAEADARTARRWTATERQRRLEHHGTAFCRRILDGAFERVYQPDGNYRLHEVATGNRLQERFDGEPLCHAGLIRADSPLRDMAYWLSKARAESGAHAHRLSVLTLQISALSGRVACRSATASAPHDPSKNMT